VEARSTVVETSAVETSAVETSVVETSAVETSSDGEFKSALESEGSSVGTAADAESSAADEPAPAVQLDATPTGDVYPETTVATSDAELPIEQDALSLTSTTPSTAERVSDENVDGETTLRQSADTPQADASGDTSASAIRTDEPRGTERHNTAFSLPSAEELPAWLESFTKVFEADEQPTMWTGLCSYPEFRASFQRLPEQQRQAAQPYLIAYQAVFLDTPPNIGGASTESDDARTLLHRALTQLLTASPAALKTWPVTARERMLDLAAEFEVPGVHSEASAALFPDAPRTNARIRLAQVCDSLARGHFAEAKTQLESLKQQSLAPSLLPVLHGALDGQRFGNVVILIYGGAGSRGSDPKAPKRHSGFCLESQRDVWIRVGEPHDAASFERHSQVYRRALIPGVVGLYTFGITRSRKPYLSVLRRGLSLDRRISHHWGLSRMAAVRLATEITLTASSLCRAGIRLPDMETRRFEIDQDERLWLSDLWGGETTEPKAQDATAVEQCRSCLLQLLQSQPGFELPRDWCDVLANAADFETLIATLRTLDRSRFWRE